MAHFPRWVEEPTLDSQALFSAYLQWSKEATLSELADTVPYLYTIEHRPFLAGRVYGFNAEAELENECR